MSFMPNRVLRIPSYHRFLFATSLGATLLFASACSDRGSTPGALSSASANRTASNAVARGGAAKRRNTSPIQHVVIIVQENRTFDNLFQGYPGANSRSYGYDHLGNQIALTAIPFDAKYDILHGLSNWLQSCDGGPLFQCKNDGFDLEKTTNHPIYPHPQYGYIPPNQSALYFQMAQQYVLSDNTFSSQIDGSFTGHQYLIAAQAGGSVNYPLNGWGCPNGSVRTITPTRTVGPWETACFNYTTLGDELDAKDLEWRMYGPATGDKGHLWLGYQAISHIFNGQDWINDVVSPQTQILTDVPGGILKQVTWVVPNFADSDHSGVSTGTGGPNWVATVINTIGQSQFWNSTAIFVIWDDWGGWYDHVPPPYVDYDGLGFRVPLLCISPYAKQGHVSHVQMESASVLRYVENNFGLPHMSAAAARAKSAGFDCLDYSQSPRAFVPFQTQVKPSYYINRPVSYGNPDDE
jgi:phospholipase C